jgi:hypothetical protein
MRFRRIFVLVLVIASIGTACEGDETPASDPQEAVDDDAQDQLEGAPLTPRECIEVTTALAAAAGAAATTTDGTDPSQSIDSLLAISEVAPEGIGDDLALIAEAFQEYFDILAGAGIDFTDSTTFSSAEAREALEEATAVLSDPAVTAAIDNVSAGLEDLCATG